LVRTRFFGKGHPLSGLDPARLDRDVPAYAGRGRVRPVGQRGGLAAEDPALRGREPIAVRRARLARGAAGRAAACGPGAAARRGPAARPEPAAGPDPGGRPGAAEGADRPDGANDTEAQSRWPRPPPAPATTSTRGGASSRSSPGGGS